MKRIAVILLLVFGMISFSAADPVYHVSFIKEQPGDLTEKGEVFFHNYGGFHMIIKEPVYQRVRITAAESVYLFPQEKTVITFKNRNYGLLLPSIELFFNAGKDDYGLSESGFSLSSHNLKGDTLITEWSMAGDKKDQKLYMTVYRVNDVPVKIASYDNRRVLKKIMFFKDWQQTEGRYYPMDIRILSEDEESRFLYEDLTILEAYPDSLEQLYSYPDTWKKYDYTW